MSWSIEGKQVIITGGTAGIGRATALELARRGARVMITARNQAKGAATAAEIRRSTGVEVEVGDLDLSELSSVREFAHRYGADHDRLDVLINNAGTVAGRRQETVDGFEWTFAVNHLGPFLLTNLLLELLTAGAPARVINVSSEVHQRAKMGLNFDDLQMTNGYSSVRAYAASKLANIAFTVELDRRLGESGVRARAVHPGLVATSFGTGQAGPRGMKVIMTVLSPFMRKPAQGAATSVLLATADDEILDGGLYWSDEAPADPLPAAVDPDTAARLWAVSSELVGLTLL